MTKSIKMKTLLGGIVAFLITLLLSVSTLITPAKAAGSVFEMEYGASVKLTAGDDGLRFMAKMDKSYRDWIVSSDKVELWGYIAPIEEFDKLDRIGGEYKDLAKKVGGKLDESKIYEYEGYYWSNIAITDLANYNYQSRAFSAIMFIVDKTGSEPKYIYADLAKDETGVSNIEAQTRTQYEVVNAAMLDGNKSYEEKLLANYNKWYGTEAYPVAAYTQAQYDALVEKVNNSDAVKTLVNSGSVFVKQGVTTSMSSAISVDTEGHVVNFYDGNNLVSKQFVADGAAATEPEVSKAGYTFEDWIGSYKKVTQDENVYAKWKEEKATVGSNSDKMSSYGVTLANGKTYTDATALLGQKVVLESGELVGGASYKKGEQEDTNETDGIVADVHQAYLAFNGDYALNDYIALDFTGKNMPEIAFFANNYDDSMYAGTNASGNQKTGIVVYTGITDYQGNAVSVHNEKTLGGVINYGFPYMLDDTGNGGFCEGAHAESALGRANLVDGTRYRVIMGFTETSEDVWSHKNKITLKWYLYNLDTDKVVEEGSMTTYHFFTGSNAQVGNMTRDQLSGSIVLYGKFGTTTVLDKVYSVFADTTLEQVASKLGMVGDGSFTLGTGKLGNSGNGAYVNADANDNGYQDYVALDGDYSYNDYVAFDFTGKNMPEIAFFARNYDNYMYSEGGISGGKHGVVVATGIMTYNGSGYSPVGDNCTKVVMGGPYMANFAGATADGGSMMDGCASELARANLVDGRRYRVIMGFTKASDSRAITLNYRLYNLEDNSLIEEKACTSYNLFDNIFTVSRDSLHGSIVLYGKFETVTTTIDKLWGVYENTTLDGVAKALGMFTATYQNWDGTLLQQSQYEPGQEPVYYGEEPYRVDDAYGADYKFETWEKKLVNGCLVYTATFTAGQDKSTIPGGPTHTYGVIQNGEQVVLKASGMGNGANYAQGQQYDSDGGDDSYVHQSYLALDGDYALNDYIALDFTGKNLPEIAFFAKNYNDSMYAEGTSKTGIVVVTGITKWCGCLTACSHNDNAVGVNGNGTQINYGYPFMIQNATDGGFVDGAFKNSALGRANLIDGTHYRVIMGFSQHAADSREIILYWYLYNLDTNTVVEESSMYTHHFFSGTNSAVGNMTINDLSGSIVLYGKFGVDCTLDKVHGVFEDTDIATVAAKLNDTYTVTFEDGNGNVLQQTEMPYGATPYYFGVTPEREDDLLGSNYQFAGWDKDFAGVTENVSYVATYTYDSHANNATLNGEGVILSAGLMGNPTDGYAGPNANDNGYQAYLAFDGDYGFDDYIVFDFMGQNMPEVAFFAKDYDSYMYSENGGKKGVVVASGVMAWDGSGVSSLGESCTQVCVSGPYMANFRGDGEGWAAKDISINLMPSFDAKLARANLNGGTRYRVIMGFSKASESAITLNYRLYNLDDSTLVETVSKTTWGVFNNSNPNFYPESTTDLFGTGGSIVLYGKFQKVETEIDKVWGVYEDTTIDAIVESIMGETGEGGDEGSGEGSEGETTTDLLGYENYKDQFDFYAYGSYSDGWYEIDGKQYYVGKHLGNLKQYSLYGGAGLTIYFPQDPFRITEDPQTIVNAKKLLDDLAKVGITKTILNDGRISWLSLLETMDSRFVTNGEIDTTKLETYVKSCLEPYANYPGVYGIQLGDEPKYTMLNSYAAVYKAVKKVCADNGWNLHIQYNLNPMIYANEIFDGGYYGPGNGKDWNKNYGTSAKVSETKVRYTEYIEAFLNAMQPDSIMYDDYPLILDGSKQAIRDLHIANLQIVAKAAADKGIPFYHVTQTFENNDDGNKVRRQVTEKGAQWLNNMLLGFGVKQIAYYTYYTRNESDSTGDESYVDGSSFVDYNGNPTALYETMKGIMSNNQIFAKVIMQFNYVQSSVYWNKSGLFDSAPDYISYATSSATFAKATVSYSTNKVGALVTELYDKVKGNYMYMAMNIDDPDASSSTASITLTFTGYTRALVYDGNGNFTTVALTNGVYTATLTNGEAVYVIPYN